MADDRSTPDPEPLDPGNLLLDLGQAFSLTREEASEGFGQACRIDAAAITEGLRSGWVGFTSGDG